VLNTIPITIKKINEHDNRMKNKKYHTVRISENTIPSENTIRSEYQKIPYRQNIRKYHTVRISENTILSEYQKIPYRQNIRKYHPVRISENHRHKGKIDTSHTYIYT
jgi:hypothetical protein